jgi:WXG100 family type VII secretion target
MGAQVRVVVNPQMLNEVASDVDAIAGQLEQLSDLKGSLGPLLSSWEGQASSDYWAVQSNWHTSAEDLNTVLRQAAGVLRTASENFASAEHANASMWHEWAGAVAARQLDVDPTSLEVAAQQMRTCGENFLAAVGRLRAHVLGAGSPWGQDQAGSLFGGIYTECTATGMQALAQLGELLGSVATGLGQMSVNLGRADQATADASDRVRGKFGAAG